MIDFVVIKQQLAFEKKFSTRYLQYISVNCNGICHYKLRNPKRKVKELSDEFQIEVSHNNQGNSLTIKGSLPYFYQGHNLFFSRSDFQKCILLLNELLEIDLSCAEVKTFEYGMILPLQVTTEIVLANHGSMKKARKVIYPHYICYGMNNMKLKIYDPLKNFMNSRQKKVKKSVYEKVLEDHFQGNKNLCKIEFHCTKPSIINNSRNVHVKDLYDPVFLQECKKKLVSIYSGIEVNRQIVMPTTKKTLDTISIILIVMYEHVSTVEELIKKYINSIPDFILNPYDKNGRKAILRKKIRIIQKQGESTYSLQGLIERQEAW